MPNLFCTKPAYQATLPHSPFFHSYVVEVIVMVSPHLRINPASFSGNDYCV